MYKVYIKYQYFFKTYLTTLLILFFIFLDYFLVPFLPLPLNFLIFAIKAADYPLFAIIIIIYLKFLILFF